MTCAGASPWPGELRAAPATRPHRITTTGALTEYPVIGGPVGITAGKDGNLYVALLLSHGLARVNLASQVTGRQDLRAGASCSMPPAPAPARAGRS